MDDLEMEAIRTDIAHIKKAESPLQKYALQLLIIVFLAGGGWMTLSNVDALAQDNKKEIVAAKQSQVEVEKKLVRIETRQEQIKEDLSEQKEMLKEILNKVNEK